MIISCRGPNAFPMPCHTLETRIEEEITCAKGSPSKTGERKVAARHWRIHAKIVDRPEVLAQKRAEAGCFVILSNRPQGGNSRPNPEELF